MTRDRAIKFAKAAVSVFRDSHPERPANYIEDMVVALAALHVLEFTPDTFGRNGDSKPLHDMTQAELDKLGEHEHPVLAPNTEIRDRCFVTDANGVSWWIDPNSQTYTRVGKPK